MTDSGPREESRIEKLGRFGRLVLRGNLKEAGHWVGRVGKARVDRARFLVRRALERPGPYDDWGLPYVPPEPDADVPSREELRRRTEALRPTPAPAVSAIVPCYNYGRLVLDAVRSLEEQTYPDVEIVGGGGTPRLDVLCGGTPVTITASGP